MKSFSIRLHIHLRPLLTGLMLLMGLGLWAQETVLVTSLKLPKSRFEVEQGQDYQLTTTMLPANATNKVLTWTSANTSVATVDANGLVTAISQGNSVVRAKTTDGSGLSASCLIIVTAGAPTADALVVNEVMPANIDQFMDPSWNYGGWVEFYNPTDREVSLAGVYVSDDAANLSKHRMPSSADVIVKAHDFQTLWFDHYDGRYSPSQVSFDMDYDGGTIYFSDATGKVLSSVTYPAAYTRCSWARTTDGGDEWGWTSTPTPAASNAGSDFATQPVEAPQVNLSSRLFSGTLTVKATIPEGATLCYTTDGSTPSLTNGTQSTGTLTKAITKTTVLRLRTFKTGMLPSSIVTRSYIRKERDYNIPILSVVTKNENLYSTSYGIFSTGPNGRAGNGQDALCNWNMDWDRPVNMEILDVQATDAEQMLVNMEVSMAPTGGWSRAWSPHSFKLKANKLYEGRNYYDYPIFDAKPYIKNKTLQVRNGGNDNNCRFKDPALQQIVARSGLNVDYQEYMPVHHFINGTYKGVINVREPNNKHFVWANYGWDSDEIDQFEMSPDSGYVQMTGTKGQWDLLYQLAKQAAQPSYYSRICDMLDVEELANYMAVEFYLSNWDWPQNNVKGYRPLVENGRFRFVLFDLDGSFNSGNPFSTFDNKQTYTFDQLRGEYSGRKTAEIEFVTLFQNLMTNDTFRKLFVDAFCLVAGSVFEPMRCSEIINELAERVSPEMAFNGESPWSTARSIESSLSASRQSNMIGYLRNYSRMRLSTTPSMTGTMTANTDGAHIFVNDLPVPTDRFSGTLFAPATLRAAAPAGYDFKGWYGSETSGELVLFDRGSVWAYYDQGSLDGTSWKTSTYAAKQWAQGEAPLGYYTSDWGNQRGYRTTLDYGDDAQNKRPTYYFIKQVTLDDTPSDDDRFTLDYTCDDGFVVYVNGTEAGRYLMPSGTPTYTTYASSYAPGNPETGSLTMAPSLFHKGNNTIAVELHNNNGSSTDIYWDAALSTTQTDNDGFLVSTEETYTLPEGSDFNLVAMFEPTPSTEAPRIPVRINEVSASNDTYVNDYWKKNDWIELCNTSDEDIDVEGMYLSDKVDNPHKYRIAAGRINTVVPAHGYLVVWCDKLEPIRAVHADFKLSADSGYVVLTNADDSLADTLQYCGHDRDHSVGRYPDGADYVYVMGRPTIGQANTLTLCDTLHIELRPVIPTTIEKMDETDATVVRSEYYTLDGMRVGQPARGIYIRRDWLYNGRVVSHIIRR